MEKTISKELILMVSLLLLKPFMAVKIALVPYNILFPWYIDLVTKN